MIYFTFDSGEGNGDLLQKYFNRCMTFHPFKILLCLWLTFSTVLVDDFEGSGYINCGEELMHLCTNGAIVSAVHP